MIPIPDPMRVLVPKWAHSHESGHRPSSLAQGLLTLGGIPIILAFTLGGGALAGKLSPWLCIPGGLMALVLGVAIYQAPPVLLGIIETIFYSGVTFVFSDGLERSDPAPSWVYAGIVAAAFLVATFFMRKDRGC
jgi:hypothetical protein